MIDNTERERHFWIDLYALFSARVVNWNVVLWSRERNVVRISQFSFRVWSDRGRLLLTSCPWDCMVYYVKHFLLSFPNSLHVDKKKQGVSRRTLSFKFSHFWVPLIFLLLISPCCVVDVKIAETAASSKRVFEDPHFNFWLGDGVSVLQIGTMLLGVTIQWIGPRSCWCWYVNRM